MVVCHFGSWVCSLRDNATLQMNLFILSHLLMTFTDEMLTNKNDYRAGLVKGHIMTSALGLNSGQQILELGSRWVCDLEAPSSQASVSIMWQLEEELTLGGRG
ncbi:hypothetical protein L3X38_038968 [Prunus dulcis]|uniref:Uncharacterized protein n=1 Tax=Prunus dulcis TaxID=3755 RepID=A0AAD4V628_PRUDU|nr:hypothetical protein L3X38_038968 [Prunus dulcis]